MCTLSLWDRGRQVEDIADALLVSRISLYHWSAIFEEHRSVNWPYFALWEKARILTWAVLTAVHTLYESDTDLYLNELVLWLTLHYNIAISVSALQENLQKAGLTQKLLQKIAVKRDKELCQQWKDMLAGDDFFGNGLQFICIDKTSKNEHTYAQQYGQAFFGE